jgi:glycerophosphoryl diester phosphodiesterase
MGTPSLRRPGAPPALIGHRGCGSGRAEDGPAENTLASLLAAVERGADWVELDVRRTADDHLVLLHHATVDDERFLADLTWAEAARLGVATDRFGVELLSDVLAALPAGTGVDLDLKTSLEDALRPPETTTAGLLADVLERDARPDQPLMVTSFDPAALLQLRGRGLPGLRLGLLTWKHFPLRKAVPAAAHLGLDAVVAHVPSFARNDVDPAPVHRPAAHTVDVAHRAGLDVLAWCPGPAEAVELAAAGVDGLIVNDLVGVRDALTGRGGSADSQREHRGSTHPNG